MLSAESVILRRRGRGSDRDMRQQDRLITPEEEQRRILVLR
jgi:hypothetical protein